MKSFYESMFRGADGLKHPTKFIQHLHTKYGNKRKMKWKVLRLFYNSLIFLKDIVYVKYYLLFHIIDSSSK